ncbi:MAG: methylmalonyl-CoA mutase family protein [Thermoleophilia bacterium]
MSQSAGETMPLAAGFPAAGTERWMDEVRRVLTRGRPDATDDEVRALFARILETPTHDGLTLAPLYVDGDAPAAGSEGLPGLAPFTRGSRPRHPGGRWDARQPVLVAGDGAAAAGRAVHELENGASSVLLDLRGADVVDAGLLDRLLGGVILDAVAIGLRAGAHGPAAAAALRALWAERGVSDAEAQGSLGLDPIGEHASSGGAAGDVAGLLEDAGRVAAEVAARHPGGVRAITVDAARYHDAGASDAQQLALAVATGIAYLRALTGAGMDVAAALGQIEFRLAAGPQQFPAIASMRALRRMWARVAEASGAPAGAGAARVHAITSRAMTTRYDPWVNLLRCTVAAFAAGVGGAEVVTVEPYDAALGSDTPLGRRLARNTQSLLMDESNLGRIADPAGGSWFVERLTEDLAAEAWTRMQGIEALGGVVAALEAGEVQWAVEATWLERRTAIAHRRDAITGVSEFPDAGEEPPPAEELPAPAATPFPPVTPHRYAEPFEAQRARADRHARATGTRPAVFLACLGSLAEHSARAGFAANLFAAGGIRPVESAPLGPDDDVAAAFAASGAPLACICSSDEVYAERAAGAATALRDAGAARVMLAGRRADADVDAFAHAGGDAVALLAECLDAAGVAP